MSLSSTTSCIVKNCTSNCCDYYGNCPNTTSNSESTNKCWHYYNNNIPQNANNSPTTPTATTSPTTAITNSTSKQSQSQVVVSETSSVNMQVVGVVTVGGVALILVVVVVWWIVRAKGKNRCKDELTVGDTVCSENKKPQCPEQKKEMEINETDLGQIALKQRGQCCKCACHFQSRIQIQVPTDIESDMAQSVRQTDQRYIDSPSILESPPVHILAAQFEEAFSHEPEQENRIVLRETSNQNTWVPKSSIEDKMKESRTTCGRSSGFSAFEQMDAHNQYKKDIRKLKAMAKLKKIRG